VRNDRATSGRMTTLATIASKHLAADNVLRNDRCGIRVATRDRLRPPRRVLTLRRFRRSLVSPRIAIMNRALKCLLTLCAVVALLACGDSLVSDAPESGKQAIQCDEVPTYMCDEYPEQCRPDEAHVLFVGLQCYGSMRTVNCSQRSDCVEAEWFAEVGPDPELVRGCINDPLWAGRIISEPSEELVAATATPCHERLRLLDENCRTFAGEECPLEEGCRVDTLQVLDPERGCATGETYTECRGVRFIQLGEIEFQPCE